MVLSYNKGEKQRELHQEQKDITYYIRMALHYQESNYKVKSKRIIKCSIFPKDKSQNISDFHIIELDTFIDILLTQDDANIDASLNLNKIFRSNFF